MFEYISNLKYSNNPIVDNLVKFRDNYYVRNNTSDMIITLINKIQNINALEDLAFIIKTLNEMYIFSFFSISVLPHNKSPDVYIYSINECNLSLDNKDDYSKINNNLINFWACLYKINNFLSTEWNYQSKNFVDNIILFEILLSEVILDIEDGSDPIKTGNSLIYNEFINEFDFNDFWKIILLNDTNENKLYSIFKSNVF